MEKDTKKKSCSSTRYFVVFSLVALLVLVVIYLWISLGRYDFSANQPLLPSQGEDKYYIKEDYQSPDPFITKVPNLDDLLIGPIISDQDPSIGNPEAEVVVVQFSDFECSFCQKQEQVIKKLLEKYKEDTRLIWKDYPESKYDSNSYQAAVAARCAQVQNKFWSYHDLLYQEQKYDQEAFVQIAKQLELDVDNFTSCLNSGEIKQLINNNIEEANALDISGIPFVYINSQEILGEASLDELSRIVDIELEKE